MKRKRGIFEKEVIMIIFVGILLPLLFCISAMLIFFLKRISSKIIPNFIFNSIFFFFLLLWIGVSIVFYIGRKKHISKKN